jgi:putative FmdB family regulatory protein
MPFYEYECASCKFYVEVMQKISDAPLKKCPSCGKSTMKKLISAPVFRLKGGGWYETDFKGDKENKRNLAGGDDAPEAKPSEAAASPDAKAGDAKPAETKSTDVKAASKPAEKATPGASRSASKSSGAKPAKAAAKPLAKAPARKVAPRPKAKAGKRRGR